MHILVVTTSNVTFNLFLAIYGQYKFSGFFKFFRKNDDNSFFSGQIKA